MTHLMDRCRIAQKTVSRRYGDGKEEKEDMLGSFVRHGLTQSQAEAAAVLQMSVISHFSPTWPSSRALHCRMARETDSLFGMQLGWQ